MSSIRVQAGTPLGLVLLGPPGVGKGTQARLLADALGLPQLASGDILRSAVRAGTELGRRAQECMSRGELLTDELINAVMCARIEAGDAQAGFILDGYPRTRAQAIALNQALDPLGRPLAAVILLDVPDADVLRRLTGRRICPTCDAVYHVEFAPPRRGGECDLDGARLEQRQDDQRETIERRLEVFRAEVRPLVEFYDASGVLIRIDGAAETDVVQRQIRSAITASARA